MIWVFTFQIAEVQEIARELQQVQAELKLANELAQKNNNERSGWFFEFFNIF